MIVAPVFVLSEERDSLRKVVSDLYSGDGRIQVNAVTHEGVAVRSRRAPRPFVSDLARATTYREHGKRAFDISVAVVALVLASPVLVLIALAILVESGWPILYKTTSRPGYRGRTFGMFKFRTMVPNADARLHELLARNPELRAEWEQNYKLRRDRRVTRLGAVLRRTSVDEFPQLLNVLQGEMSIVGPRPVTSRIELENKYGALGSIVLSVRPGLTGLWQVSGRSSLPYDERVRLDLHYVETVSFARDVKIILQTPAAILRGDGAY